MQVQPWNNWFHCCGSTYGTWVRGDGRGCVGAKHWHALVRCVRRDEKMEFGQQFRLVRKLVGQGKGFSARHLSKAGLAPEGGVWAKRCRPIPIKNREHPLNVAKYIPGHAKKGAAVYSLLVKRSHG